MALEVFEAGKGINATKVNANFAEVQQQANDNESNITIISNTALLKDGSNLTQAIVDDFQKQTPIILAIMSGTIALTDNRTHFLELTGDGTITLPTITPDQYSHTIILIVQGGNYSLDFQTATGGHHLYNPVTIDPAQTYNVMFIYNKIDGNWYYSLTQ